MGELSYFWTYETWRASMPFANKVAPALRDKNGLAAITEKFPAFPPLLPDLIFAETRESFLPSLGGATLFRK